MYQFGERIPFIPFWGMSNVLITLLLFSPVACSRADREEALDGNTGLSTGSDIGAGDDQLTVTGSIQLEISPPVDISQAEVRVIVIGDGRPNVVQIASYDTTQDEHEYPAVLWQGPTTATDAASLAGQTVQCDMYYQQSETSKIAMTKPGESVELVFGSADAEQKTISATLKPVELLFSDDQPLSVGGGRTTAVIVIVIEEDTE